MTLDELHDLWDEDCKINEDHLDRESVRTPNLHAKYLRFLIQHKMKIAALHAEYNTLRQKKFRFYRGEMPQIELTELKYKKTDLRQCGFRLASNLSRENRSCNHAMGMGCRLR